MNSLQNRAQKARLALKVRVRNAKRELLHNKSYQDIQHGEMPKSDKLTDHAVHDILQHQYVVLFNEVKTHPDIYYYLLLVVTRKPAFQGLKTYHNLKMGAAALNDVVGLGIITLLLRSHTDAKGNTTITDISYNGRFMTYQTNDKKYVYGQQPGEDASILTPTYISRLINKFTFNDQNNHSINKTDPIFNGMYNNIRVSVTYGGKDGLTPRGYGSTFALRISGAQLPLNVHNFSSFAPNFVYNQVMSPIIKGRASCMISGETGTAKTSLQKLLVGLIQQRMKIIMIEDTPETHLGDIYPQKDIVNWITRGKITIADHVETSLRNNPDWVMVAEVRDGKAAYQMFQSVKTGHAIMTTLHAKDNKTVPSRFVGMIRESMDVAEGPLIDDFLDYMDIGIHCSAKMINGHLFRYMDELAEFVPKSAKHPHGINVLFEQDMFDNNGRPWRTWQCHHASSKIKNTIWRNYGVHWDMPYVGAEQNGPVPLNDN